MHTRSQVCIRKWDEVISNQATGEAGLGGVMELLVGIGSRSNINIISNMRTRATTKCNSHSHSNQELAVHSLLNLIMRYTT